MQEKTKLNILWVFLYSAGLTALTLWAWGYYPLGGDSPIHLVFIYHSLDRSLFPNDDFVATLSNYHSFFWRGIALIATWKLLPIIILFFHLLSTWLLFIAVMFLAHQLYGKTTIGLIAGLLLIIFNFIPWGGALILSQQLDHGVMVRALLLFALWFFLRHKVLFAFLLLGISFNLHPVMAFFMAVIFSFLFFSLKKGEIRDYIIGVGVALIASLPMILRLIEQLTLSSLSPPELQIWLKITRLRLWWHLFPSLWSKKILAFYFFLFVLWLVALWRSPPGDKKNLSSILLISLAVFTMCLVGLLGSEFFPQHIILKLHLFYSLKYWAVLVFISFASLLFKICASLKREIIYNFVFSLLLLITIFLGTARLSGKNPFVSPPLSKDWIEICRWMKEYLPKDAKVLTPPFLTGFRLLSLHSPYVEWKDGGALPWADKWTVDKWWVRILTLSPEVDRVSPRQVANKLKEDYQNITLQSATQTGADYFIAARDYPGLKLLVARGEFRLYKLK